MHSREHPSPEYSKALGAVQRFHRIREGFDGTRVLRHIELLRGLCRRHGVQTALDYGCGKGLQHSVFALGRELGVDFTLYDPGLPAFKTSPTGPYDLVVVCDVLEYVPASDVLWVLHEIFRLTCRAVFLAASTVSPRKLVPADYSRDEDWWLDRIAHVEYSRPADWVLHLTTADGRKVFERQDSLGGYRLVTEHKESEDGKILQTS